MKSFLKCYGWHLLLFVNIYFIFFFVMEIAQMYDKANWAGNQSVEALSNVSIQFKVETEEAFDFSFLSEEKQEFILLQRLSDNIPLYRVVFNSRFIKYENDKIYDKEDYETNQAVLICGNRAEEIIDVNHFVYNNREYQKTGVLKNDGTLASEYGVFLVDDFSSYNKDSELILEGYNKRSIKKIFEQITEWSEKQGYTIKILDKKEAQINDLFDVSEKGIELVLLSILILCSSIVIIMYFWESQYDETRNVYFLMGIKNVELKIWMDYTKVFAMDYICILITFQNYSWITKGCVLLILYVIMTSILSEYLILKKKGIEIDEKNMERNYF